MCFRSLALSDRPIYAWHDVASAKVGRSRPRGSVLWLLPLQLMPVRLGPFYVASPGRSIDALAPARLICYPHRLDRPSRSFPRLGSPKSPL